MSSRPGRRRNDMMVLRHFFVNYNNRLNKILELGVSVVDCGL